jgi:hypothetical protein
MVLGKEHPDTFTSINNLANVLVDQGKEHLWCLTEIKHSMQEVDHRND